MGLESGFVTLTPFYFLLTIVPAVAFVVCYIVMVATDKEREIKVSKKTNSTVKMSNKKK